MTVNELTRHLALEQVEYEVIPHARTLTARDEAFEIGLIEVGKTVVLATERGFLRAVVPAAERLDLHKVRVLTGSRTLRLASEEELAGAYPMFELGAVPPFGGPTGDRTIVDRRLAHHESMVLEAGTHEESIRLRTRDLIRLTDARIEDICED